ncbi:unnamed protein product [Adineta steineri]|uniref:Uncharacterized protein n=1 Tax=Adineta steineri TaxID=433720 RepID=A0A815GSH5_9BILA|nr:unnamed protein product [Adineta steineri]CAF4252880.1 unnamed protein product [Adineta steineri]
MANSEASLLLKNLFDQLTDTTDKLFLELHQKNQFECLKKQSELKLIQSKNDVEIRQLSSKDMASIYIDIFNINEKIEIASDLYDELKKQLNEQMGTNT